MEERIGDSFLTDKPLIRILLIDDDEDDACLIKEMIQEAGRGHYQFDWVDSIQRALERICEHKYDIYLVDYLMGESDGLSLMKKAIASGIQAPFIVLTGQGDHDIDVHAMRAGAVDYLVKGRLDSDMLERSIRYSLEQARVENALRRNETRLKKAQEIAHVGNWELDLELKTIWASEEAFSIYGIEKDNTVLSLELVQSLVCPEYRQKLDLALGQLINQTAEYDVQFRICRQDNGEIRHIHSKAELVLDETDKPRWVLGVIQDITVRNQAEERVQRQIKHLAALRKIDLTITSSPELSRNLQVLLEEVIEQLGVDAADILLVDPSTSMLKHAADIGFLHDRVKQTNLKPGYGYAGRAIKERRIITINDLGSQNDEYSNQCLVEENFKTYVGVPLVLKGKARGVLEVYTRQTLTPDQDWLDFLGTLAGQAAIAIDNATLFSDLQNTNVELVRAYDNTLEGWARALELRDKETKGHCERVTDITLLMAAAMGIKGDDLVQVRRGAMLHDIGKMAVPDHILNKPGPLTEDEWVIMRQHPVYAYEMLEPIDYLKSATEIPRWHHERWDGTGYPDGLKAEEIPLSARIFSIVDVWDALRSERPYRGPWEEERVLAYLEEQAGIQFDPEIVKMFLRIISLQRDIDLLHTHTD